MTMIYIIISFFFIFLNILILVNNWKTLPKRFKRYIIYTEIVVSMIESFVTIKPLVIKNSELSVHDTVFKQNCEELYN